MEFIVEINKEPIASLKDFIEHQGRCHNMRKNSILIIQNGVDDDSEFLAQIKEADDRLTDRGGEKKPGYQRVKGLDSYLDQSERTLYFGLYEKWCQNIPVMMPFRFENTIWNRGCQKAFEGVLKEYHQEAGQSDRMKNFFVLLLHRIAYYFPKLFTNTRAMSKFPKLIMTGQVKTNDFYFLKLLALCGADVYAINPTLMLDIKYPNLSFFAQVMTKSREIGKPIPLYRPEEIKKQSKPDITNDRTVIQRPRITTAPRAAVQTAAPPARATEPPPRQDLGTILEYEELAGLAASVVMITAYNHKKQPFATGSGVLISGSGYILTNFHVIRDGISFGIQLEEEDQVRWSNELIKYHPGNDLALLRIDPVQRPPIPVYRGAPLIRGQKVVAIGSPLGLFNTVSDGIIGGFRTIKNVPMIQFSAPVSHGSSGGALLNRYGQLIGIVTAGFDDGQNLNLAVEFDTINRFLQGFI